MIPYRSGDFVQGGRSATVNTFPFKGKFSDWTVVEKHGPFAVMTDGFAYRVFDERTDTFVWRDISPNKCSQYAMAEARHVK